nr:WGR domain-containing protein [Rhizobium ruizarguesonis]
MSLDVPELCDDYAGMISQPYQLYVERTDAAKNMARYYAMEIERTMFGEAWLKRRWGRIGKRGQEETACFRTGGGSSSVVPLPAETKACSRIFAKNTAPIFAKLSQDRFPRSSWQMSKSAEAAYGFCSMRR